jgi:hypothetical protein
LIEAYPSTVFAAEIWGAVVQIYEPDGLEIEFVTASGKTQTLVTLNVNDVRPVQDSDLIAVRSVA